MSNFSRRSYWQIPVISLVYFLLAKAGLLLATINESASPVWPATGFAFFVIFHFGWRAWPAIAAGALTANLQTDSGVWAPLLISLGNTLEALFGGFILVRVSKLQREFAYQAEAVAIGIASLVASAISASVGVVALYLTRNLETGLLPHIWFTWWIGDVVGGLVITPLLIRWQKHSVTDISWYHGLGVLLYIVVAVYAVFFLPQGSPFLFLLLPSLLYAALTLKELHIFLVSLVLSIVCVTSTVYGYGPFVNGALNERLLHLQLFLASIAFTALVLSGFSISKLSRFPAIVIMLCWVLSGALFYSFEVNERNRDKMRFHSLIEDVQLDIDRRMETYEGALRAGVGLFAASQSVELNEWRTFLKALDTTEQYPGINGLGVIVPVSQKKIAALEQEMSRQGLKKFKVKPVPGFTLSSAQSPDALNYVIKFIEPLNTNILALGVDIGSEPLRREAADLARDSGQSAITSRISLVQDRGKGAGFLLFAPIYNTAMPAQTIDQRRKALTGWVYGPFNCERFFQQILEKFDGQVDFQAYEGERTLANSTLFTSAGWRIEFEPQHITRIELGKRTITIAWQRGKNFKTQHDLVIAWVGLAGALFSLLLTSFVVNLQVLNSRSKEMANDLTKELTEAKRQTEEDRKFLLNMADLAPNNLYILDFNSRATVYNNKNVLRTLGYEFEDVKSKDFDFVKEVTHPDDWDATVKRFDKLAASRDGEIVETIRRVRDIRGVWHWLLVRESVFKRHPDGRPEQIIGVSQDVTDIKDAEARALEATQVKSQFLANMSHEIRTPLNGIIGLTDLLRDTQLTDHQRDYTESVIRSAEGLLAIINDILDFSKIEAGKLELELIDFDIQDLLENVYKSLLFSAKQKEINLSLQISDISRSSFKGDPGRIRQVLTNLVSNAIKFTPNGNVVVSSSITNSDANSATFHFEVKDSGIGMTPATQERLFQAFSQADATTSRRFGGTGLGLSICKRLADLMGGKIGVESKEGVGSTFWFDLTLKYGEGNIVRLNKTAEKLTVTSGARILIAEDNPVNQQVAIETLKKIGYRPHAVGNGNEVIEALREIDYDVILMDCQMPGVDGFQATAMIRKSKTLRDPKIPIVAITANAMKGDREKCLAAGMDDYISKPMRENDMIVAIEKCLSKKHLATKKGHILVAEDNLVNQDVMRLNLDKLGYSYDVVSNGFDAVEMAKTKKYDLVLMDCSMPVMDGYQATEAIRKIADSELASVPIIAVTANSLAHDRQKCLDAGMDDYLSKPIKSSILAELIDKWHGANEIMLTSKLAKPKKGLITAIDPEIIGQLKNLQKPGGEDIVTKIIKLFLESSRENVELIRKAIQDADLKSLTLQAHSLKSAAANVGAVALSEVCLKLENCEANGTVTKEQETLLKELEAEFIHACEELKRYAVPN